MQFWNDSDIPLLISTLGGVPVVVNGVAGFGIAEYPEEVLESPERPLEGAGTVVPVTSVLIQTSAFPGVALDQTLVVEGVSYRIRGRLRVDDGALMRLFVGTGVGQ